MDITGSWHDLDLSFWTKMAIFYNCLNIFYLKALLQNPHLDQDLYREVINQYILLDRDPVPDGSHASSSELGEENAASKTNQILTQVCVNLSSTCLK